MSPGLDELCHRESLPLQLIGIAFLLTARAQQQQNTPLDLILGLPDEDRSKLPLALRPHSLVEPHSLARRAPNEGLPTQKCGTALIHAFRDTSQAITDPGIDRMTRCEEAGCKRCLLWHGSFAKADQSGESILFGSSVKLERARNPLHHLILRAYI